MNNSLIKIAKWENILNMIIGAWIFSIPWVIGFGFEKYETNYVMWNFALIGAVVITTSIIAFRHLKPWAEWTSFFTGIWLFASPLFLFYFDNKTLLWNSLICGLLISGFSAMAISIAEKRRMYYRTFRKHLFLKQH